MRFTDDREQVGVLETLVRMWPAFAVAFVLSTLAAGAYALVDLEAFCTTPERPPFIGVTSSTLSTPAPSSPFQSIRLAFAGVGTASGLLALGLWRTRWSRSLWWPTLLIPVALLWDLGLEPQFRLLQVQIRFWTLDAVWRASVGVVPLIGSYVVAARLVDRRLSFGPLDAVGLGAVVGLYRCVWITGLQFILPGIVAVAVLAFVPTAAFFDRDRAVLSNAIQALTRAPAGALVSVLTYVFAGVGSSGLYAAVLYLETGDMMRGLVENPREPMAMFTVELVYIATHTAGGLVLFALWHARVSPPEATEQAANPVGE